MELVYVLIACLLFLPLLLVLLDSFFRVVFLGVAGFSYGRIKSELLTETADLRILILVLAHNEQNVIGRTIDLIKAEIVDDSNVTLALLADNCIDDTVGMIDQEGVKVFVRSDGDGGKGQALSWFTLHFRDELDLHGLIVIFDADTIISKDFCRNLRLAFRSEETQVVQSFADPVNANGKPVATLAAFSEILSQRIDDEARSCLGWTSPLRGTGMIFRRDIFLCVCHDLRTQVDDIEISLRLAEMGIPVLFYPRLKIFDPKSTSIIGLAKQRGRWLKGQRQIFSLMKKDLKNALLSGFSGWSLIQALLFKPKTLLMIIKIVLVVFLGMITVDPLRYIFVLALFVSFLIDLLYYLIGLKYVSDPLMYLLALLKAPLYLVLWFIGWIFSIMPGQKWLRSRD